jgi:hypothetical protein
VLITHRNFPHARELSQKNFGSDDHFDRAFLFMAVKGNYETKRKESQQQD